MIYGCYGYSGRLIVQQLLHMGVQPLLAGRDKLAVQEMARQLNLEHCSFQIDDEAAMLKHLSGCKVLLNCAGPFVFTARHAVRACLKAGVHYLDITGEYQVFEELQQFSRQAQANNLLLLPGVGFDVVPSDCLAAYLRTFLPTANRLELALYQINGGVSRGTALTVLENMGDGCVIRENGQLTKHRNGSIHREIAIDGQTKTGVAIAWGDVSTAYYSTRIPNITVYNILPDHLINKLRWGGWFSFIFRIGFVKEFLRKKIVARPSGPSEERRTQAPSKIWGEVRNEIGAHRTAILHLPEGYTLTALMASTIAMKVLQGEIPATGFHTPSTALGADFILQFSGVMREDLP